MCLSETVTPESTGKVESFHTHTQIITVVAPGKRITINTQWHDIYSGQLMGVLVVTPWAFVNLNVTLQPTDLEHRLHRWQLLQ